MRELRVGLGSHFVPAIHSPDCPGCTAPSQALQQGRKDAETMAVRGPGAFVGAAVEPKRELLCPVGGDMLWNSQPRHPVSYQGVVCTTAIKMEFRM